MAKTPTDDTANDARHEKALDLAEQSLGEFAKGHVQEGDRLAKAADKLDHSAALEVAQELEEDDSANHAAGPKA